jgi:uncharacterized protein RhaS with RHS repeats
VGRFTWVGDSVSSTSFTAYDVLGRVTGSTQTTSGTAYPSFSYTYNPPGSLATETYPSGRKITFTPDGAGRVSAVCGLLGTATTNYTSAATAIGYAPHGAIESLLLGNGLTESTSFNSRLQPTQIQAQVQGSASLTLQYGYGTSNNNGNLLSQTIQGTWTQNYLYDGANRLLQAAENSAAPSTPGCVDGNANWCETYGYDAFGNRRITARTKLTPSAVEAASYNPATNQIADSGWSYDAAGNILTDPLSEENRVSLNCVHFVDGFCFSPSAPQKSAN